MKIPYYPVLLLALPIGTILAQAVAPALNMAIPQSEWISDYYKRNTPNVTPNPLQVVAQKKAEIKYLTIHNFGCPKEEGRLNTARFDHITKRLGDVGYHYIVSDTGKIFEGRRPTLAPGSFTYYLNKDQLGKEVISIKNGTVEVNKEFRKWTVSRIPGNTKGHITVSLLCGGRVVGGDLKEHPELLSPAAMEVVVNLVAELLKEYGLKPDDVYGHRQFAETSCPNDEVYKWLRGPEMKEGGEGVGMAAIRKRYSEIKR